MRSSREKSRGSNSSSSAAAVRLANQPVRRATAGMPSGASPFRSRAERVRDHPDPDPNADSHRSDLQSLAGAQVVSKGSRDEQSESFEREKHESSRSDESERVPLAGETMQLVGADERDHGDEDLRREER